MPSSRSVGVRQDPLCQKVKQKLTGLTVSVSCLVRLDENGTGAQARYRATLHKLDGFDQMMAEISPPTFRSWQGIMNKINRNRVNKLRDRRLALAERGKMKPQRHCRERTNDRMRQNPDAGRQTVIVFRESAANADFRSALSFASRIASSLIDCNIYVANFRCEEKLLEIRSLLGCFPHRGAWAERPATGGK